MRRLQWVTTPGFLVHFGLDSLDTGSVKAAHTAFKAQGQAQDLADALKRRGVTEKVLQEAMKEIAENS